jgi:hypothetical protein
MSANDFFQVIVRRSRLGAMLAPFTVTRLLVRAGVDPKRVSPEALRVALPEFETGLRVYLGPDDLEAALRDLRDLAA